MVGSKVASGETLAQYLPSHTPAPIASIVRLCFQYDPAKRPSAAALVRLLQRYEARLAGDGIAEA